MIAINDLVADRAHRLADESVPYYVRMERGSLDGASDRVLDLLANALQLDEAERAHLLALARGSSRSTGRRRHLPPDRVRPVVQQDLLFHRRRQKRLHDPVAGRLDLDFESMELPSGPGLVLTACTASAGTPTADALAMLGSWAALQDHLATEAAASR